ncbi:MAG: FAD-dependent oxidoreductase [Myxococcota bacterium]
MSIITEATIQGARSETPSIRRLLFQAADPSFTFLPGQWIDLARSASGVAGGFSMASAPGELGPGRFELGVRRSGHPVSQWLHDQAAVGDVVLIRGGQGPCVYQPTRGDRVVFVAGGIGLTPMLSMARAVMRSEADLRASFWYSVRDEGDVAFRPELERLRADGRFTVQVRVTGDDPTRWLSAAEIRAGQAGSVFYLCGPPGMVDGIAKGLSGEDVRFEKWW